MTKNKEPIAIIGIGCRFPGANNPETFWQLLCDGVDAITEMASSRWDAESFKIIVSETPSKINTHWGGFLEQVDQFDAEFFGISLREVASMDPQQRLLLEVTWEALEDAGQIPELLRGTRTGVFVGIGSHDYSALVWKNPANNPYATAGTSNCIAANRISYLFDFIGPSLAVDTACSSSLVAIHLACQSLWSGESTVAVAGGVNLLLLPEATISMANAGFIAPDGRCKTFDARANGYVRGEGAGIVVLKPLSQAQADSDLIYAIIRGSAVNQDGCSNGLTAPNPRAQEAVLQEAYRQAGISPGQVQYIEAHGTGTKLGDPIEMKALGAVLAQDRLPGDYCAVGTVKTNIGHLEAAAGVAGLIKVALSLKYRQIPSNLHFQQPNPYIHFSKLPLRVQQTLDTWPDRDGPALAGVSSFGFGGTNAHVVLEEAPKGSKETRTQEDEGAKERPLHILTLGAKSEKALQELARSYEEWLANHPAASIADVCFMANTRRSRFDYRLAVIAESTAHLQGTLSAFAARMDAGLISGQVRSRKPPKVAFLFTGQGSQYAGMGRELYLTHPTFRQTLDLANEILLPYLEKPLLEVLYPPDGQSSPLNETAYTQPALFALEYSLFQLWKSWGIEPAAVVGHSLGEYVAATVAGVFSLEDGLKLIAARARLMQALPPDGEMVAVLADEQKVRTAIQPYSQKVAIAAINGPENIVISGEHQAIEAVCAALKAQGIKTKKLQVSHAFHSPKMSPMLAAFEQVANEVTYSTPQISLISNLTGQPATNEIATPEYWCQHVRQPVRFSASMETLHQLQVEVFVEIGPMPTLLGMGRRCLPQGVGVWLPSLRPGQGDWQQMLQSLAQLYVGGVRVDWSGFDKDYLRRRVVLPTYSWQRQCYWIETANFSRHKTRLLLKNGADGNKSLHPLLGQRLHLAGSQQIRFESQISQDEPVYLTHYRVFKKPILPATAYIEMALAAGATIFKSSNFVLEAVALQQALILPDDQAKTLQLILTPEANSAYSFQIFSLKMDETDEQPSWTLHASGKVVVGEKDREPFQADLAVWQARCHQEISPVEYYQQCRDQAIDYGSSFQPIERLWRSEGLAIGQVRLPEALVSEIGEYKLHPVLLEACIQALGIAFSDNDQLGACVPVEIERVRLYRRFDTHLWVLAQINQVKNSNQQILNGEVCLYARDGQVIAKVEGLQIQRTSCEALLGATESWQNWLYQVEWRPHVRFGSQLLTPGYLPTPEEISANLSLQLPELIARSDLKAYGEILSHLEALSIDYVLSALEAMEWEFQPGRRFSTAEIAEQLGVVSQHRRLLGRLLEMLAEVSLLQQINSQWEVTQVPREANPQEQLNLLLAQYPNALAELTLLERCGSSLAQVLRGERDPIQLLFPEGDLTTATHLYQDSPGAQVINTLVQKAVLSALEHLPQGRGMRVLEIGAGTGGTTSYILPILPAHQTEYVFTDLSPRFTTQAQEKFRNYGFVRYQILNIELDPKSQGFEPHQYDLIVAANVLHATRDLHRTLEHVQQLLAPNGMLVLLEGTAPQRWMDLVFGLTEGWWKFADLDLRPNYPLLATSQWQELLLQMGFKEAVAIPSQQESQGVVSGQAVIVAQTAPAQQQAVISQPRNWLLMAERCGIGQQLATILRSKGEICTLVFPGKEYEQLSEQEFSIDPAKPENFQQLLAALGTNQPPLYGVVHCWSLEAVRAENLTSPDLKAASMQGCGSILHLIQALLKTGFSIPPRLWLVTRGAQPVTIPRQRDWSFTGTGQDSSQSLRVPGLAQSPLWGMGKVIALEHPELNCVRVDLDPNAVEDEAQALLEEIWLENDEDQVAFCDRIRYVPRLVRDLQTHDSAVENRLEVTQPVETSQGRGATRQVGTKDGYTFSPIALQPYSPAPFALREDGTYLITGGMGGLGLLVARWMVRKGARHLVLLGRTGARATISDQLRELEEAGAQVVVAQADVSDALALSRVLSEIEQSLPPLRGVIHSVGVLDDGVLQQQTWERFARVMAPKVEGSWHLHTLTLNLPLDFFVLFSSAASLLGSPGQANHAAANAFLDALVFHRRAQGLPGLSINWGVVAEVGAAAQRQAAGWAKAKGMGTISPQQVIEVLEQQLFLQPSIQVGVVPVNWSKFIERSAFWAFFADFQQASGQPEEQRSGFLQQLEAIPVGDRRTYLVAHICWQVAKVLGLNPSTPINLQQGFFDLGMDSLISVELRNRLQNSLECSLPSTLAFDYPTVEALVDYLSKDVISIKISSKSKVEPQSHNQEQVVARSNLEQISDSEAEALLISKLESMRY